MKDKADRLRAARIAAGFDEASKAAETLGVSTSTYTSHENGTRGFKDDSAKKYARRFGVTVEWLVYGLEKTPDVKSIGFAENAVQAIDMETYKSKAAPTEMPIYVAPFSVNLGFPEAGIFDGALILVDLKVRPTSGDLVVATRDNRKLGFSETMIRRLVGHHLVGRPSEGLIAIDSTILVRGKIIQAVNTF